MSLIRFFEMMVFFSVNFRIFRQKIDGPSLGQIDVDQVELFESGFDIMLI